MTKEPARRKGAFTVAALAGAVAGCTALTGAGEFLVTEGCMDCGDGGPAGDAAGTTTPTETPSDGGIQPRDGAHEGPPACDEKTDLSCLALPGGWTLVAVTDLGGGKVAECPDGFDGSKEGKVDVGQGPTAQPDTCACGCKVTESAQCSGPVTDRYGTDCFTQSGSSTYSNSPPNTCLPVSFSGTFAAEHKFTLSPATGGKCTAGPPTFHQSRVTWEKRMRLCSEVSRCSGGVCDARLDAPFRACIAHEGDQPCPESLPQRAVVGEKAAFDCSGTCDCNVTRSCAGTITHYSDSQCTQGAVVVAADDVCRVTQLGGKTFGSYKVDAIPTTTCTATGTATASNGRLASLITLCCR